MSHWQAGEGVAVWRHFLNIYFVSLLLSLNVISLMQFYSFCNSLLFFDSGVILFSYRAHDLLTSNHCFSL